MHQSNRCRHYSPIDSRSPNHRPPPPTAQSQFSYHSSSSTITSCSAGIIMIASHLCYRRCSCSGRTDSGAVAVAEVPGCQPMSSVGPRPTAPRFTSSARCSLYHHDEAVVVGGGALDCWRAGFGCWLSSCRRRRGAPHSSATNLSA